MKSYLLVTVIASGALVAWAGMLAATSAAAQVKTELVDYQSDKLLEGYLAYDKSSKAKRPGIVVVHTRRGIQSFVQERTRELASLGYVALAVDVYGKGIRPKEDGPSAIESARLKNDRALTRARVTAGYDVLKAHPLVDASQLAVIGYCVGGLVALELARSGAPLGPQACSTVRSRRRPPKMPGTSRAASSSGTVPTTRLRRSPRSML